jgi:uncharacterized protein (DUF1778 family)
MTVGPSQKQERLEARVTHDQKELLQQAAALEGTSLTDFIVRSAQRAAEQVIRDHSILVLTHRESQLFVEALLVAQAPNAALRSAAEHYKDVTVLPEPRAEADH